MEIFAPLLCPEGILHIATQSQGLYYGLHTYIQIFRISEVDNSLERCIFSICPAFLFHRSLRRTYCLWQMLRLTNQGPGGSTLPWWFEAPPNGLLFLGAVLFTVVSNTLQVYNRELRQDVQVVGHSLRRGAAHARRSQKRGLCNCLQQPLWVMSRVGKTLSSWNYCSKCLAFQMDFWCYKQEWIFALFLSFPKSRDKIATGSFDKTCKLWCAKTGKCFHTYCGHVAEIVRTTHLKVNKLWLYVLCYLPCP